MSTLYKRAVDRTEIENLIFHGTMHEAITRLAEKLVVLDLARMVGDRDIKQLMRYYIYTINVIESLNSVIRQVIKKRKLFPN